VLGHRPNSNASGWRLPDNDNVIISRQGNSRAYTFKTAELNEASCSHIFYIVEHDSAPRQIL
jgi:hypothetical protein